MKHTCFLLLFLLINGALLAQSRQATRRPVSPVRTMTARPTGASVSTSQAKPTGLALIAKVTPDSVLLRWVPINYSVWSQGVDKGYIVTRTDAHGNIVTLTPSPLLPSVGPLDAYADTTKQQDMTLLSVALYKAGSQEKRPDAQLRQSHEFFMMSSLLNYPSSKQAGVGLVDASGSKAQSYTYTVSLANDPAISASVNVNTAELTRYGAITNLTGRGTKQTLDMNWNENTYQTDYPYYNVERSADGVIYKRINKKPFMNINPAATSIISFREQIPGKDTVFYYRVRGVDYFTQESEPSNVVKVMAIPELPLPTNLAGEQGQNKGVTVRWQFPVEYEKYITKFRVTQSKFIDDFYETAVDSVAAQQRETQFIARDRAIYVRVHYTDRQGTEIASAPRLVQLVDTIPPVAPVQVAGKLTKDGLLTLDWATNKEDDLLGYYVFASNDSLGTPTRITDTYLTKNTFQDSVAVKGVANRAMYYYVLAVDTRYNHSDLSQVAVVQRPDLVPPTKPNFVDYEVVEKRIMLTWVNPADDDISRITLRRRAASTSNWTTLQTYARPNTPLQATVSFTDTTVTSATLYEYDVLVEDQAGNTSQAYQPLVLKAADELVRVQFTDVKAVYDPDKQQVVITWKVDRMDAIASFIIQREYPGEELSTWQVVQAPESGCTDDQLHKDAKQTYVIKAKLKEGYVSPTSATTAVQL